MPLVMILPLTLVLIVVQLPGNRVPVGMPVRMPIIQASELFLRNEHPHLKPRHGNGSGTAHV